MHKVGYVHSDIKPQNILITRDEKGTLWPVLADIDPYPITAGDKRLEFSGDTIRAVGILRISE